jgi:hypothetical protein
LARRATSHGSSDGALRQFERRQSLRRVSCLGGRRRGEQPTVEIAIRRDAAGDAQRLGRGDAEPDGGGATTALLCKLRGGRPFRKRKRRRKPLSRHQTSRATGVKPATGRCLAPRLANEFGKGLITPRVLRRTPPLTEHARRVMASRRAYERILKVSRTIADLEGSDEVVPKHGAEAVGYRSLDRTCRA